MNTTLTTATATATPGTGQPAPAAPATRSTRGLWRTGLLASVAAAAATTAVAAVSRAADVPMAVEGETIPILGFAIMTIAWSVVGILMAAGMARWTGNPRRVFLATTVTLTVLSCIPSLTADAHTATRLVLAATHLVAAAIVIPAVASRLGHARA